MGLLNCLKVSALPVNVDVKASAFCVGISHIDASAWKIGDDISVSAFPVCPIKDEESPYIPFLVKEGAFILSDGSIFKVLKL